MPPDVARPGSAASAGCRTSPAQDQGRTRHQKGTTRPGTGRHAVTQTGTTTSENGPRRYGCGPRVRIDTEVLISPAPVLLTIHGR